MADWVLTKSTIGQCILDATWVTVTMAQSYSERI